jgi:hypothetical protein
MATITWDSAPDYDEWGSDAYWNCQDWITWHRKLVEHFNAETANQIWNYAYALSGNLSSNLNCRTFNASFRDYVKKNDLKPYDNAGIFSPVLQGYGTATDITSNALDSASNIASGVFDTAESFLGGTNLKRTINVVLIVGGVLGIAYVYKSFKK